MLRTSYSMPHIISLLGEVVNRPLPADAVTILASARGAFHLPLAADKTNIRALWEALIGSNLARFPI